VRPQRRLQSRLSLGIVSAVALAGAFACRTPVAAAGCPSVLSHTLSTEEEKVRELLPDSRLPITLGNMLVLWKGIVETDRLATPWRTYLSERTSSAEVEAQALLLLERRYREAFAAHEKAIETCEPKPNDYDKSWAEALRAEFGDKLKVHAKSLRSALALAYVRAWHRCRDATRTGLLISELEYRAALEDTLRGWMKFVDSNAKLSPTEKANLLQRAEAFAGLLRKVSVARVVLDGQDIARLEVEANKLPADMSAVLNRQHALSKPFSLTRASEDLNRMLE
jgi:hypothetical protein